MATRIETSRAAHRLHDALRDKTRDLAFGNERNSLFEPLRLVIANAIGGFAERSAHGGASPHYDAPRAACDHAADLVRAAVPQPNPDRAALISATNGAAAALAAVTRPSGLLAGLAGALRLNAPAPQSVPVTMGDDAPRDIAFGAPAASEVQAVQPPGDPNYYQKLTNLFPAEGLALYGTGVALYSGANAIVVLGSLVVLGALRWFGYGTSGDGQGSRTVAVAVAAASFLLWATATDPMWIETFMALSAEMAHEVRRGAAFAGAASVLIAPLIVKVPTKN